MLGARFFSPLWLGLVSLGSLDSCGRKQPKRLKVAQMLWVGELSRATKQTSHAGRICPTHQQNHHNLTKLKDVCHLFLFPAGPSPPTQVWATAGHPAAFPSEDRAPHAAAGIESLTSLQMVSPVSRLYCALHHVKNLCRIWFGSSPALFESGSPHVVIV